ncbi:MAG: hypothetical protein J0L76_08945 [Rhodobacterales bacterium]|nr:hypothetical protein [Rhodobacterales bacterium]
MKLGFVTLAAVLAGLPAQAEEPLTLSFSGTVAGGWLDFQSISSSGDGYGYDGAVVQLKADAAADYAITETLSVGLAGRLSAREGTQARYDGINLAFGQLPGEFGTFDLDLAAYLSAGPLVLYYGDVESSFSFATLDIGSDRSPISADGAILMNIGGGMGTAGRPLSDTSALDPRYYTSRTTRADLRLGEFTASVSRSSNDRGDAESAGLRWTTDLGDVKLAIGAGFERGPPTGFPQVDYRSFGGSVQFKGFTFVISDVRQLRKLGLPDYDLHYRGYSASYDFGAIVVGASRARQDSPMGFPSVFVGEAKAYWLGWDINETSSLDFEMSESDYQTGNDVDAMSLVYSYRF